MSGTDDSATFTRFAGLLAELNGESSFTARLCEASRRLLGADGVALTLGYLHEGRLTAYAGDDLAARLDDEQEVLREGPAHDAATTGQVVVGRFGPGQADGWAMLRAKLEALDFSGTVVAVPLHAEGRDDVGVLSVHLLTTDAAPDLEVADFIAATVATAMIEHGDDPARELAGAWESRAVVHQATGMIVAQVRVHPEDALAMLRGQAFARGTSLVDVAQAIVERRINFRNFTIEGD